MLNLDVAANHWSQEAKNKTNSRLNWRQSGFLVRELNRRVCGEAIAGATRGLHKRLKEVTQNRKIHNAISIGCGRGEKEMALLDAGLVENFLCYEISEEFIKQGRELAIRRKLENRIVFIKGNAFELSEKESFDLVHWNSSLHHMLDTHFAVKWSYDVLKKNGIFYMDDYIGPNRFQWSDEAMEIINFVRKLLPVRFFKNPKNPDKFLIREVNRPNKDRVAAVDPTEAVDSENILLSVLEFFPDAEIAELGCAIIPSVLNNIIYNIDEIEDESYLSMIALIDELSIPIVGSNFASALATKKTISAEEADPISSPQNNIQHEG